jgi:hypothetical protein
MIYTTNYDLLTYWACMVDEKDRFIDFFYSNGQSEFDPTRSDPWDNSPQMLFLHGALHLRTKPSGIERKLKANIENLLEQSTRPISGDEYPLFITEGNWEDKMSAIRRSRYLSFAYSKLEEHDGGLVIFGHSLSEQHDNHILRALATCGRIPIAVSVRTEESADILQLKARLRKSLPKALLVYFRADSHPLGASDLEVAPAPERYGWRNTRKRGPVSSE